MSGINWLDIIVLILVLVFGLKGLKAGIVREIFGILGLIGGLYLAIKFQTQAGEWISQNIYNLKKIGVIEGHGTINIVGFLATLFGVWIVCLIVGEIFAKLFKLAGLGIIDKAGGFIFSALKVFLIFSVFAVLIKTSAFLNSQVKPYFQNSIVYPYLLKYGQIIMQIDTNTIKNGIEVIQKKADDIQKIVIDNNGSKNENLESNDNITIENNKTINNILDENLTDKNQTNGYIL